MWFIFEGWTEILLYYFHNETLLFVFEEGTKNDLPNLFSDVKNAKVGYAAAGEKPFLFVIDKVFPPKMIQINYANTARESLT